MTNVVFVLVWQRRNTKFERNIPEIIIDVSLLVPTENLYRGTGGDLVLVLKTEAAEAENS